MDDIVLYYCSASRGLFLYAYEKECNKYDRCRDLRDNGYIF